MKFTTWLIASLSGLSTIHAQNSNSSTAPRKLPATIVEANRDRATPTAPTPESSRKELAKTPGGTEVVEAERYLQGRASTVADTFALSPGVFAQSRFGSDEARLSIRGSGIQRTFHGRGIRVMQDGVPLNLADGGFDFQALDPLATSHIDVWRGANALAYGSSTLGGAINYHSRTGRTNPGLFSRLEAGSYGYLRGTVAGGKTEGSSDAYGAFTHQSQDGFRDHAQQSNQRLFSNFGQQLNEDVETRFYLSAVKTDSELPGNLTKEELENDPSQADTSKFGAEPYDAKRDFELFRLANKTSVKNGDTTFEVSSAWSYKDLDHPIAPIIIPGDRQLFGVIDQLTNDFLLGVTATNTSELFGRENQLRAGVLYTTGMTTDSRFANNRGTRGDLTKRYEQTATNLEGFVEDQHAVGNDLTVVLGTSASMNRRDNDTTVSADPDYALDYTNISPKLGLRWDGDGIQAYTNISRSYEPPSFSESYTANTAREAQEGTTFEIGTRGTCQAIRWDASIYHAKIDNELLAVVDPITLRSDTKNADDTTHSGIELGTHADLLGSSWEENPVHRLVFGSAWTYGRFRFDDDATYGDNDIAGLPEHLVRGELLWQHSDGWYAGPTFEWVPVDSFIDHRNTFSADAYAICGFKFGRRIDDGISWFIEARNLTDEAYAATTGVIEDAKGADSRQFLPGDGRSIFAGIEWKW
jgi:iron complex outermembrane receptor protein